MSALRYAVVFLLSILLLPAQAEVLGVYRDWTAVAVGKGEKRTCMIWSQPSKSRGFNGKRGEVFVFVTHLPAERRLNRVSFKVGYALAQSEALLVNIGDSRFALSAAGSGAWASSVKDDLALIDAMRVGRSMSVEGKTREGSVVRDRYSLYGFTAAYTAINAACKVR